jgi:hypothetical protein
MAIRIGLSPVESPWTALSLPPSASRPVLTTTERMFGSIEIPYRLDADELHHARPALREGTDRERPEDVVIEAGHTAELRGERARVFRRDDTDETVSADRPDPKCWIAVVGAEPAAHHETGTGESRIGLASGRHVDGLFCCDLHAPEQRQNESEDVAELQSAPGGSRRIGAASPDCSALVITRTWVPGKPGSSFCLLPLLPVTAGGAPRVVWEGPAWPSNSRW